MYVKPTGPQGIGSVLDGSFRLVGSFWRRTWLLALMAAITTNLGAIYDLATGSLAQAGDRNALGIYVFVATVGAFLATLFNGAMLIRLDRLAANEAAGGEIGMAFRRAGWLILLAICATLVLAVACIPMAVYLLSVRGNVGAPQVVIAALLSAPILLLFVSLWLSSVFFFVERLGPINALRASHRLVWGKWWRTATILTIGGIVALTVYLVVAIAAGAIGALLASGDPIVAGATAVFVVVAAMSLFIGPYILSLQLVNYFDLKQRREGVDLLARAEAMS